MDHTAEQAEEEFRAIFEMSLDLICVVDLDTAIFEKINPSFTRVLGHTEGELLGRSFLDFVHPDDVQSGIDLLEHNLKKGKQLLQVENRYRTKAGHYRWLSWTAHPIVANGLCYAIAHDVTERKRLESLLAGEKRVLEIIATSSSSSGGLAELVEFVESQSDGMNCSILVLDKGGDHVRYGASKILPADFYQVINELEIGPNNGSGGTTASLNHQKVIAADITNDPLWGDYHDLAKQHDIRAYWSIPIRASNGKVLGTFAMYCDQPRSPDDFYENLIERAVHLAAIAIERKNEEKYLRESEIRSRTLLEGSPVCNKIIDLDSQLLYMSTAGQEQLKISNIEEFYGSTFPPALYPESWRMLAAEHLERAKAGEISNLECPVLDTEGNELWFDTTFVPARDKAGHVEYVIVTSVNITERKRADELQKALVEGTVFATGPEFFHSFAKAVAQVFKSRYVLVCEHLDSPATRVKTLAFWMHDHLADNIEYDMAGGPCEETAMGEMTFYPEGLQELFPKDKDLVDLNANSYCGFPLFDSSGQLIGHLAIMDDCPMNQNLCEVPALQIFVSRVAAEMERKRVEKALVDSELLLKTVISNAPLIITSVNESGDVNLFEGRTLESFGLQSGQFVDQNYFKLWEDKPHLTSSMAECLSGSTPAPTMTDIADRTLETRYSPMVGADGEIAGAITVCIDITDRMRVEEELRQYEHIVASSTDMLALLDDNFVYLAANEAYRKAFGFTTQELIGKTAAELFGQQKFETVIEPHAQRCFSGEQVVFQNWVEFPEYGTVYMDVSFYPYFDRDNNIKGFVVNGRDITERKQAEEKIRRQQNKLAHFARLSTMGEMATGLAHEVNQPLAAIANYCYAGMQFLDKNQSAGMEPIRELFEKLTEQSLRAGEIIRRLRGFVSKKAPARKPTDISEPIQEVLRLLDSDLRQSEVHLVQEMQSTVFTVKIDAVLIQQVLVNLIRNAIDAMTEAECKQRLLTVSTLLTEDDVVEIAISDTGRGIPAGSSDQVFDAFFSSKAEGMGMGLAISRSIIESHGGEMWMTPNEDQGVTFHFTLPIEKN